jgi:hypothetical protein
MISLLPASAFLAMSWIVAASTVFSLKVSNALDFSFFCVRAVRFGLGLPRFFLDYHDTGLPGQN